jgi:AcrR family transcriptional regulator
MTDRATPRPADLREACVAEAYRIIAEQGLEQLSLREVARRLGVSHQAPYRHFPSRDHILAEVIARAYDDFAAWLNDRPATDDAFADLGAMGRAYLDYAVARPLHYRLMFGTPLPAAEDHPTLLARARHAFAILRERLSTMPLRPLGGAVPAPADDALFVWASLHGLAMILQADVLRTLELPAPDPAHLRRHVMGRIGQALAPEGEPRC